MISPISNMKRETTSNLAEEFTLVLCVTPESSDENSATTVGGDTTIYTFGGAKTYDTTTTGRGILFRKDLEHEGVHSAIDFCFYAIRITVIYLYSASL
jgi:hypothetical protein